MIKITKHLVKIVVITLHEKLFNCKNILANSSGISKIIFQHKNIPARSL